MKKDDNESLFYTNITLDGRLITVGRKSLGFKKSS